MKIISTSVTIFIAILLMSCNNSGNQPQSSNLATDSTLKNINKIDTLHNEQPLKAEKKIKVSFKTKLVEWGGDGKWHDMYKNDNGSYWVNYSDPFKIIITGYYPDLAIKLKSSSGSIIFEKLNAQIPENGEFIISNDKMIGEYETSFFLEIKEMEKILFKGSIESVPGGE
ncbi:MAG: hypothetical protein ACKO5W_03235 [Crocinitomicaceae bacterium]